MTVYGGIEAGGSKWECAVGTGPDDLRASGDDSDDDPRGDASAGWSPSSNARDRSRRSGSARSVPSTGSRRRRPGATSRRRRSRAGRTRMSARRSAAGSRCPWPSTPTSTPPRSASTAGAPPRDSTPSVTSRSGPGSAAARWSAERSLHGLVHPEFGHMRIPHDRDADPFPGVCPYHGDCWEGLASGRAIEARWGRPAVGARRRRQPGSSKAEYLALGLVCVIIRPLPGANRDRRRRDEASRAARTRAAPGVTGLMNGYLDAGTSWATGSSSYITLPALGSKAGILGAIALAETA